jgi:hypothetical protein
MRFARTSTSVSATDVPPNFMTSVLCEVSASPATAGTAFYSVVVTLRL